jgi:hypothetical protein
LCPALDSLPPTQKSNIYRILSEARATFEDPEIIAEDIDYESRKKSFEGTMAYLLNVCKREWLDGWEEQFDGTNCGRPSGMAARALARRGRITHPDNRGDSIAFALPKNIQKSDYLQ